MKFSVIMPVYGVEPYLAKSVGSVLAQTFADFELLLIDDRSPDNCPALCDAYAQQDERVRVIHHAENQGLSGSRNTGLAHARGEYVLFMDSDDWIAEDTLEYCHRQMDEDTNLLVFGVTCAYEDADGNPTWSEELVAEPMVADTPQGAADAFVALNQHRIFPYAWNKVYRKAFLDSCDATFQNVKLIEDFVFNIRMFRLAGKIQVTDKPCYFYRRPAHETLASKYSPDFFNLCKQKYQAEKDFLTACGDDNPEHYGAIETAYIKHFIAVMIRNRGKKAGLTRRQQAAAVREMLEDPMTREVLAEHVPTGIKTKVIVALMRSGWVGGCRLFAAAVDFAQTHMLEFYKKHLIR